MSRRSLGEGGSDAPPTVGKSRVSIKRRGADQHHELRSYTNLVQMIQQIGGILIESVNAGSLQFLPAGSSRKQSHSPRPPPPGSPQVPHALSHNHPVCVRATESRLRF